MGPDNKICAQLDLYFPVKIENPCPVILNIGWDCPIIREMNERGYIFAGFGPERFDRSVEGKPEPGAVERAYPGVDGGTLAAWAWGASRMLDYLQTMPEVDGSKVVITGHSRCGKAALLAGAVDERFAMVNPNGSGCGGAGLYVFRVREAKRWKRLPVRNGFRSGFTRIFEALPERNPVCPLTSTSCGPWWRRDPY